MGGCISASSGGKSSKQYLDAIDGTEDDFHKRYFEDRILGEGEFGVVKLVHDMTQQQKLDATTTGDNNNNNVVDHQEEQQHREPLACKIIRKGMTFKDNTLYAPLKPGVLKMECDILRTLAGQHYCLQVCAIYESSRLVYILTEYCSGGSMLQYLVNVHGNEEEEEDQYHHNGLRTEDVSRIAFQLLDAIHHCEKHHVIHRDIKPDNIMFRHPIPGAELRLIDFGSGTMDTTTTTTEGNPSSNNNNQNNNNPLLQVHTTFAGSGFYISPEMYQREYTSRTDVWSAGVVLYVLVAGYPPADDLQKAFNMLHRPKRNLRKLPHLPSQSHQQQQHELDHEDHNDDHHSAVLPDSFYDLLDGLLKYHHVKRKSAGDFLQYEFVQLFKQHNLAGKVQVGNNDNDDDMILSIEQIAAEAAGTTGSSSKLTKEKTTTNDRKHRKVVPLSGSVRRHSIFLGYQNFERAITTLLAALLTKPELVSLIEVITQTIEQHVVEEEETAIEVDKKGVADTFVSSSRGGGQKLQIIAVHQLKTILKELNHERALMMIEKLPDANLYEQYAYHVALLLQFARESNDKKRNGRRNGATTSTASRRNVHRSNSFAESDNSISNRSTGSLKQFRYGNTTTKMNDTTLERGQPNKPQQQQVSSVHGNNVYEGWKAGKLDNPRKLPQRTNSVPIA